MVMCFAPDCKHYSDRGTCKFFRFPKDDKAKQYWIKLIRRADRGPSSTSLLCSCHFKSGLKENGPTMFEHNITKQFVYRSPEKGKQSQSVIEVTNSDKAAAASSTKLETVLAEADNYFLRKDINALSARIEKLETSFSFQHISHKDDLVVLYTGLPNKQIFEALYNLVSKVERTYYLGWKVERVEPIEQLFMTLYKLRLNAPYRDIAQRFNVCVATVTNIFVTWLHVLHEIIYKTLMSQVPGRSKNLSCMPECFSKFPNTRIIIDCTEIYSEVPNNMDKQRQTYSSYKHRNTLKGLIGVAPNGVVTFVSNLYPGSTSDKKIVEHCGILKIFKEGDLILADKGFLISDLLPPGVSLNIPPFLLQPQFSPAQVTTTTNIARARIHVERAIRRVKAYHILNFVPQNLIPLSTKIFQVCAALTNLQYPLIKEVEMYYKDK